MKKTIIVLLTVLTLALISCDTGNDNNGTSDPNDNGRTYAKELWGEWLRMDTGDKWYISDNAVKVNGAASSTTATLTKQSERVVEVTDGGRKYYLYASRIANASFTGTIVGDTGTGYIRAVGASRRRVTVANRGNKSNISSVVTGEQGIFTAEGIIPGDTYEVTPEGGTPATVKPDNDGSDVGVITVTSGVNFKTAIIPAQSTTDVTEMYINENHAFNLEFENTGTEDCPAPSYTIVAPEGVTITGNLQGVLGTIEPGVKKSVPINVTCSTVAGDYEYKKIRITITDGNGKTWEDSVSLRFYKETMDFNIRAERPISGIVISPDSKIYSFINVTDGTLTAPRRVSGDYLVVFSGATLETETNYALGIGVGVDGDLSSFYETGKYEPNNTEGTTVSLGEQRIMAYLHKNDIDYYRVSYGDFSLPPAPTDVTASVADAKVSVSWNAVSGASSYNIYRSTSQGGTYAKVGTSAAASYTDTVTIAGTYYYKVSAIDARKFESFYSAPRAVAVAGPPAPTNVSARVADAEVTLSWDAASGATSYNVYRSDSQDGTYAKVGTSTSPSYIDTIAAMGTYYYKAGAVSAGGLEGAHSAPTPATVAGPPAPTNVSASAVDAVVTVSWNTVEGASSYNIYRSDSQDGAYSKIGAGASLSYGDTIATTGTYYYKVGAVSAGGLEGAHSAPISVTIVMTESDVIDLADTLSTLSANARSSKQYTLFLVKDETISAQTLSFSDRTDITITLKGKGGERTVNLLGSGSLFTVSSGVTLELESGVILKGHGNNNAELVLVGSGGKLLLKDGAKITGNTASFYSSDYNGFFGGGVGVVGGGTFTMSGGEISGNTVSSYSSGGGGVGVTGGTFTMSGGVISGNTASANRDVAAGGGVGVTDGTFTMSGGTISGNTASSSSSSYSEGGGVYSVGGTFTMSGGEISGNRAKYGGGVGVDDRTFTMSGGTISGNRAEYGGGAFVGGGTFTFSGGTIGGNAASIAGGGAYVNASNNAAFIKQSVCIIYGSDANDSWKNTATNGDSYGHAVYVYINSSTDRKRNTTAGAGVTLNSGSAGGWE